MLHAALGFTGTDHHSSTSVKSHTSIVLQKATKCKAVTPTFPFFVRLCGRSLPLFRDFVDIARYVYLPLGLHPGIFPDIHLIPDKEHIHRPDLPAVVLFAAVMLVEEFQQHIGMKELLRRR